MKILSSKSFYKKKKKKNLAPAECRTRLAGVRCRRVVNFNTYFFLRDKLPISMKMLVFFLAKCVRNAVKTMVVDRKNQKALALLYLASKPLRKAANSSGVPIEFEQNRRGKFELFA